MENSRGSTTGTLGPSSERAPSASCGRARRRRPPDSHAAAVIRQVNKRAFFALENSTKPSTDFKQLRRTRKTEGVTLWQAAV